MKVRRYLRKLETYCPECGGEGVVLYQGPFRLIPPAPGARYIGGDGWDEPMEWEAPCPRCRGVRRGFRLRRKASKRMVHSARRKEESGRCS